MIDYNNLTEFQNENMDFIQITPKQADFNYILDKTNVVDYLFDQI